MQQKGRNLGRKDKRRNKERTARGYIELCFLLTFQTQITTWFNTKKFHVLPTKCIYVFRMDLRTSSDYFPMQHSSTDWFL
jgi:hypothetical protein